MRSKTIFFGFICSFRNLLDHKNQSAKREKKTFRSKCFRWPASVNVNAVQLKHIYETEEKKMTNKTDNSKQKPQTNKKLRI